MNTLTLCVLLGVAIWWYKPLRRYLIQRTNRLVKALLIAFPVAFLLRLVYGLRTGEQDERTVILAVTVTALTLVWLGLMWFTSWLERRRPAPDRPVDWSALGRLPGVPRIPGVTARLPGVPGVPGAPRLPGTALDPAQVQRAAEAASPIVQETLRGAARLAGRTLAEVEKDGIGATTGRVTGRLFAKMRKSLRTG